MARQGSRMRARMVEKDARASRFLSEIRRAVARAAEADDQCVGTARVTNGARRGNRPTRRRWRRRSQDDVAAARRGCARRRTTTSTRRRCPERAAVDANTEMRADMASRARLQPTKNWCRRLQPTGGGVVMVHVGKTGGGASRSTFCRRDFAPAPRTFAGAPRQRSCGARRRASAARAPAFCQIHLRPVRRADVERKRMLVTVRDPVDRAVSAFEFRHPTRGERGASRDRRAAAVQMLRQRPRLGRRPWRDGRVRRSRARYKPHRPRGARPEQPARQGPGLLFRRPAQPATHARVHPRAAGAVGGRRARGAALARLASPRRGSHRRTRPTAPAARRISPPPSGASWRSIWARSTSCCGRWKPTKSGAGRATRRRAVPCRTWAWRSTSVGATTRRRLEIVVSRSYPPRG